MFRHIAYVSSSRSQLDGKMLSDIFEVSNRNNERDGITGVLMYHAQMFFQVLEGERHLVAHCYDRICADRQHMGIAMTLDETAELRSFPDWRAGYVGPDEIDEHTGGALLSLAGLKASELNDSEKRGLALDLAKAMFDQFSKR